MNSIKNRAKTILNLAQYDDYNTAARVTEINNLVIPKNPQYILRLLIKNTFSKFAIPANLLWTIPLIEKAVEYQKLIGINHSFCYLTVRSGPVISETDDEWHVDGFSTQITHVPEQNYIWSNKYPTQCMYKAIEFPLTFDPLKHNIHTYIQKCILPEFFPTTLQKNTLYCLDPYVIHRRPTIPEGVERTFVRISFTPIEIIDVNNTVNPLLKGTPTLRDGVKEFRNNLINYAKKLN